MTFDPAAPAIPAIPAHAGCPAERELARFVDGDFTPDEADALAAHRLTCARCHDEIGALTRMVADLSRDPLVEEIDLSGLVLRRAALPPRRRAGGIALVVAAASAAASVLGTVAVERHRTHAVESRFQSRGVGESPDQWVAIHPYRVDAQGTSAISPTTPRLTAGEGLLVAYDNGGPSPYRYLMVFAVDERGRVFWDYPASSDMRSVGIPIEPGIGHELREEVRWSLARGPLRLVGLFSRAQISVGEVERALRRGVGRLPFPDTGQQEIAIAVTDEEIGGAGAVGGSGNVGDSVGGAGSQPRSDPP